MKQLAELLYPELRALPPEQRERALGRAKEWPFDVVELLGMAAGLVLVTAFTRYGVDYLDVGGRFALAVLNFLVAIPLLALAAGPFLVRRTRRGLQAQMKHSGASGT
jgi:hypothetical protein